MEAHDDSLLMAGRAVYRIFRDTRKRIGDIAPVGCSSHMAAAGEFTLKDFLANEPDLYSASDIKVRYR